MDDKCIICNVKLVHSGVFLCERHTNKLEDNYKTEENIITTPTFKEHCMICGEWENRIIINYPEWNYICNVCLKNALDNYVEVKG